MPERISPRVEKLIQLIDSLDEKEKEQLKSHCTLSHNKE